MSLPTYESVQVGDALPPLQLPPVDRTTLALFGGASGDHNPIHIDTDFARRAGMPDVFAQGMLGMAWLGRVVTRWIPQSQLRRFDARFFTAPAEALQSLTPKVSEGELNATAWFSLEAAQALDLPSVTRFVLSDLNLRLGDPNRPPLSLSYPRQGRNPPVPADDR